MMLVGSIQLRTVYDSMLTVTSSPPHLSPACSVSPSWLSHRSGHVLLPCGNCHSAGFSTLAKREPRIPAACGRIYLTSFASSRTGGKTLQSQVASMTRSSRLLLVICCATNILQEKSGQEKAHPSRCRARAAAPASPGPQQRKEETGETQQEAVHMGEEALAHLFGFGKL